MNNNLLYYLPQDRLQALAHNQSLPDYSEGAALLADISGFTALTETLTQNLGSRQGAEELAKILNIVYTRLIEAVDNYRGTVIGFSGDAITCWFEQDNGTRAVASGLAMQAALSNSIALVQEIAGTQSTGKLALKVAVASGKVRRFLVGDPQIQLIETLAGSVLDRLAELESQTRPGQITITPEVAATLESGLLLEATASASTPMLVVTGLRQSLEAQPWPALPETADFSPARLKPWLLPAVYERLIAQQGEFITELRPAVALFLRFAGIHYDSDSHAGQKLDSYISQVQTIASHYGGNLIDLTIGDKGSYLYIAFGVPVAHENDTEHAVRASLELLKLQSRLDWLNEMQIGISQGLMRAGTYGGATRRAYSALGDEVNLAARLMQAAAPGQILASAKVYQSCLAQFSWQVRGTIQVKGKSQPIQVFQPLQEVSKTVRPPVNIVGRRSERAILQQHLHLLRQNQQSGLIIIEGEAGVGKSRLVEDIIGQAEQLELNWLLGAADPIEQATPYFAWRAVFEQLLTNNPQNWLSNNPELLELSSLLGVALPPELANRPDATDSVSLSASDRAKKTRELFVKLLLQLQTGSHNPPAENTAPLVLILEDAHWLDSASWALAATIARQIKPLLLVIVTRPLAEPFPTDYKPLLQTALAHLKLESLSAEDVLELVCKRLGATHLPDEVARLIWEKAQGNPFFSEELGYVLRDTRLLVVEATGACYLSGTADSLKAIQFPDTVQGVINSRIDMLPLPQQLTLKVASVIGRTFSRELLEDIYPIPAERSALKDYLVNLQTLDITPLLRSEAELTYIFKHNITQEVTYNLLPFSQSRPLHQAVANWYEQKYAQADLSPYYSLLAYHYASCLNEQSAEPELIEKALYYLQKASEQALRKYANPEAIEQLRRALQLIQLLPVNQRRSERELTLRLSLAKALMLVLGWNHPDVKQAHEAAYLLGQTLAESPQLFAALSGLWSYYSNRGETTPALKLAQDLVELAERLGDPVILAEAHFIIGSSYFWISDFPATLEHCNQALALYRVEEHDRQIFTFGKDTGITAYCYKARALWQLGYPDSALRILKEEATPLAASLGDINAGLWIHYHVGLVQQLRGEVSAVETQVNQLLVLSNTHNVAHWRVLALYGLGWVEVEQGLLEQGRNRVQQLLELSVKTSLYSYGVSYYNLVVAESYRKAGQEQENLALLNRVLEIIESSEVRQWEGEYYRRKGESLLALSASNRAEAVACFEKALAVSRSQQAKIVELQAATSLAQLWQSEGNSVAAYQLLKAVYDWFSEGFATPPLQTAKLLLEQLEPDASKPD